MHSRKTVPIPDLMSAANMELIRLDFKSSTLSRHSKEFRSFSNYCRENEITAYDAETGPQYFQHCYGLDIGNSTAKLTKQQLDTRCSIRFLDDIFQFGYALRYSHHDYTVPRQYVDLLEEYLAWCHRNNSSDGTIRVKRTKIRQFFCFLDGRGIELSDLTAAEISDFMTTLCRYRDTFKLLLIFCRDEKGFNIAKLNLSKLDKKCIEDFLLWLTNTRGSSPSTYNQRLCAIHAFFDYVMTEEPTYMEQCILILKIPSMVSPDPPAQYLTPENLKHLLSMPDTSTPKGRRHLVLLTVLYDTAARVSELADICMRDVRLDFPAVITLHGKGGKIRTVPLMKPTTELLRSYLEENHIDLRRNPDMPLFWNGSRHKLTRSGITYIVQKYADMARETASGMPTKISPHIFRHTKAMHMVQANVNPVFIKDYLGHADISTTEVYARADNEAKRAALEKATAHLDLPKASQWEQDAELIEWLSSLG